MEHPFARFFSEAGVFFLVADKVYNPGLSNEVFRTRSAVLEIMVIRFIYVDSWIKTDVILAISQ